jgi:hypothetical protein
VAGEWLIQNLSRYGTQVNTARIEGPTRLADGDRIRVGNTILAFLAPDQKVMTETRMANPQPSTASLSSTQRRILIALCRPMLIDDGVPAPASNDAICAELGYGLDAVKKQLGRLFQRYGFDAVRPVRKRVALARYAIDNGLVARGDL